MASPYFRGRQSAALGSPRMVFGPEALGVIGSTLANKSIFFAAIQVDTFLLYHNSGDTHRRVCRHLYGSKSPAFEAHISQL